MYLTGGFQAARPGRGRVETYDTTHELTIPGILPRHPPTTPQAKQSTAEVRGHRKCSIFCMYMYICLYLYIHIKDLDTTNELTIPGILPRHPPTLVAAAAQGTKGAAEVRGRRSRRTNQRLVYC